MKKEELSNIGKLVIEILRKELWAEYFEEEGLVVRTRVFPWALVIWLMLWQRIGKGISLSATMDGVVDGKFDESIRSIGASRSLTSNSGGYSQARNRLPLRATEIAVDAINSQICNLHKELLWQGKKVYLVDGSTLTLPPTKEIVNKYPASHTKSGKSTSVWPKMLISSVHDLMTGVALRPEYAAMYGDNAVNEIELFRRMLFRVPANSVIVADRAYGIFRILHAISEHGHDAVIRVTDQRANKFLKLMREPGEMTVTWTPSSEELKKYQDLPCGASITGKFIWYTLKRDGFRPMQLYLFTTLDMEIEQIVELYGRRWNIENDIRDLKLCLALDHISAKTTQMVEKELILAYTAYNLIRHIITMSANFHNIDPRRVSFKRVLNRVVDMGQMILSTSTKQQVNTLDRFIDNVPNMVNKVRKRPPQLRKKFYKAEKYPPLKLSRNT